MDYAHHLAQPTNDDSERKRSDAWSELKSEMVPEHFPSQDHLESVCAQLVGTGFLFQIGVFGGNAYKLSPLVEEVASLADFEAALKATDVIHSGAEHPLAF